MGKQKGGDNKPSDKNVGGKAAKGKGKGKDDSGDKDSKVKGAQSINVRHILVSLLASKDCHIPLMLWQCEKHAKKEEALAKLRDGVKFDEVAREFSEDKARQGE